MFSSSKFMDPKKKQKKNFPILSVFGSAFIELILDKINFVRIDLEVK